MADEVDFQSGTLATPAAGTKIATRTRTGIETQKVEIDVGGSGSASPLVRGQQADADSLPVTLSSEQAALIDGLEGLLTSIKTATEAVSALVSGGALKVDDDATQALLTTQAGYLDGVETAIAATNTAIGLITALISGGAIKVDDDATQTLLTTLAGYLDGLEGLLGTTNTTLSTIDGHVDGLEALATTLNGYVDGLETLISTTNTTLTTIDGRVDGLESQMGATNETAPANDTATVGLNGRLQRIAQHFTSLITLLTPSWGTTTTAVLTPQMLAKGAVKQTTFSAPAKGGYLKVKILRSGSTAIDVAIQVRVRRITGDTPAKYYDIWFAYTCGKTTAAAGVAAGSGNNAGVGSLTLNAGKTFAAGPNGDIQLGVIDDTTTPTTATEFLRQSLATSTTVKLLEFPTQSAHNSTSHVVCDQAEVLSIWVDAGETYSLSIDYGAASTGDSVYIDAYVNPQNN